METAKRTAKNINVGDAIALMHEFKYDSNGWWLLDADGEMIPDPATDLQPCLRGYDSFAVAFKTITNKEVTKVGGCTVTILTCEDGSSYSLNARNAYVVEVK